MGIQFHKNLGWCLAVATAVAVWLPAAAVGRLELRNEISGVQGRDGKFAALCWSSEDDLGWQIILPGQSRSWTFTTVSLWPFQTTEFRCKFRTAFGSTGDETVRVFSGGGNFLKDCDDVNGEKCIRVVKRSGLYHRKIRRDGFKDVMKSKWVWKW